MPIFGSLFLTRPSWALGRGLVMGSKQEEQEKQQEDIFEIQFLVHKCLAWGAPNRSPGPKLSTSALNQALAPEPSTWALNEATGPSIEPRAPNWPPGPRTEHLGTESRANQNQIDPYINNNQSIEVPRPRYGLESL